MSSENTTTEVNGPTGDTGVSSQTNNGRGGRTGSGRGNGNHNGGRGRGRGGRGNNSNNRSANNSTTFRGETKEMNGNVFQCHEEARDPTQFNRTLEALERYANKTYASAQDLQKLFDKMKNPTVEQPTALARGCRAQYGGVCSPMCEQVFVGYLFVFLQSFDLDFITTRQDGEAAPGFRVEVLVIDVEADGVAFALPLVAAPEFEEFDRPVFEGFFGVIGECDLHNFENILGALLVADGGSLHRVENRVRHEVGLVCLLVGLGAKFRSGLL